MRTKIFMIWMITFIFSVFSIRCYAADGLTVEYIGNSYDPNLSPVTSVIVYTYLPVNGMTSLDILDIKTIDYSEADLTGYTNAYGGFHKSININGVTGQSQIWFADASKVYSFWSGLSASQYQNAFFSSEVLNDFHLGTMQERKSALFGLNILRFRPSGLAQLLGPWVVVGLSIFLAIPFWWLLRKVLR